MSLEQAMTLVRFGNTFKVDDRQYWRQVQDTLNSVFDKLDNVSTDELFRAMSYLKEYNLVSNKMMRVVSQTKIELIEDVD